MDNNHNLQELNVWNDNYLVAPMRYDTFITETVNKQLMECMSISKSSILADSVIYLSAL